MPGVAVVTGGNKGIGYGIVKGLCEKYDGVVYLTARDIQRGQDAVAKLKQLGLEAHFHQLDINDLGSIKKLRDYLQQKHCGIDLLVNNAAIAFKVNSTEPFDVQAEKTLQTNYFGTLQVCETLFPILKANARVVNISSSCGHLSRIPSSEIRAKLSDPNLTVELLNDLMKSFIVSAKEGKNEENGWGNSAYVVSKVGISALTILHQKEFDEEEPNRNISVNSVHPGYVATDMSSYKGPLTIEEGSKAPLYLCLEPHSLKGKYLWKDATVVDWYAADTPARV